jgi:hypothetical protein
LSPVRYNRVPAGYWRISHGWGDRLQKLGLYLQTCSHRTGEGLYLLPVAYAARDLGWTVPVTEKHMRELVDREFITWDPASEVVLLHNALEIQAPTTEKQIKGAIDRLKELPPTPLLSVLFRLAQVHSNGFADSIRMAFPNTFEWVSEPGLNGHSNSQSLAQSHTQAQEH